ncbi:helix-turn-helix transcriptional regulator [Fulvivirga ulvae]|uniref:helix-turn-helix domain-containing protein n=1 Tax=Fulvivirga ulvae TaxID=2904245 RepID=UPI001F1FF9EE|nr:helix-turn-helix domain-containing protein [Fulvivirga ulvae]UII33143.1 helix-turn-helix transcriptional regulator [Fulvivirga ulvae]
MKILNIGLFESEKVSADFYCNTFKDHLLHHHQSISVPHKHDFFLTVLFTKGSGVHEIDFDSYTILPGSVFFLYPGQTHHWELSEDIDGYIFFHTREFFEMGFTDHSIRNFPFFYSVHNQPAIMLKAESVKHILPFFESVYGEYIHKGFFSRQKISSLLNLIYIELSRVYLGESKALTFNSAVYSLQVNRLEQLIETYYRSQKSPAAYADMMNITPKHLNRLTRETLGKTTTQLITERILLEAKRMLVYVGDPLSTIAEALGYDDYAYFSRVFKKWTGLSPSQFAAKYKSLKT